MKLIDLIKLSNYNVILFKDNHMQFANQKEKMSLENAYTENNTVVGDDYIKQFPPEVIDFMQNIKDVPEIIDKINKIQKDHTDLSFGIYIGTLTQSVIYNEEKSHFLHYFFLHYSNKEKDISVFDAITELNTILTKDFECISDEVDEDGGFECGLVYNIRTKKIMELSDGVCCIAQPTLYELSGLGKNTNEKIKKYENSIN